jgi:diguanylate cyclase (GGDEF)-like protein
MQQSRPARPIPVRALVLSGAALAVPVVGQIYFLDGFAEYEVLLWLLALVPAFLFAFYRGWTGAAEALAAGMALLAMTQVVLVALGRRLDHWPVLLAVVMAYVSISLAVGLVSELLHRERERAESLAMIDELTGLPNRRLARRFLDMEVAAAQRGRRVTLVMFDLDNFKHYNDRHGHLAGDAALAAMGRSLVKNTRKMNLSARWGGEEFVSILSDTDSRCAQVFIRRVRDTLRATPLPGGPVTFSAGIAEYGKGVATDDDLLDAADQAMYGAKSAGRDRTLVYEPSAEAWAIPNDAAS